MVCNRGIQQGVNRVSNNIPYNKNSRVNQRSQNDISSAATYVRDNTTIKENHASICNDQTNRNDSSRTAVVENNSNIYNTNLPSDVNNIENNTIKRDESNEVIGIFTNNQGRIKGTA